MTLQAKLLCSLIGGIVVVYGLSELAQQRVNTAAINRLSTENLAREQDLQWHWVKTVESAAGAAHGFAGMTAVAVRAGDCRARLAKLRAPPRVRSAVPVMARAAARCSVTRKLDAIAAPA